MNKLRLAEPKEQTLTPLLIDVWMDGWMICEFTSFSTVFQSYQDDGQTIMKSCVQWNLFTVEKILPRAVLELGTARSVGQSLIH